MKYLAVALMYTSFFAVIGFAVWWTESAWCLWALLLTPSYKESDKDA
jgi:hypothetical protein